MLILLVCFGLVLLGLDNIHICIRRLINGEFNAWAWVVVIGLFIIGYPTNPDNKIVVNTPVNSTSMGYGVDLSVLGEMDGVIDYYIDNSKLYIYTVEDSINDEIDRIKFINSFNPGLGE